MTDEKISFNLQLEEVTKTQEGPYRRAGYNNPEKAVKDVLEAVEILNPLKIVSLHTEVQGANYVSIWACFKSTTTGLFYSFYGSVNKYRPSSWITRRSNVGTTWTAEGRLSYIIGQRSNIIPKDKA